VRAIVVRRHGGPEVLVVEDAPEPQPGSGQVRIRVAMAGVNFTDTERRRGLHALKQLPWIPGIEVAGVVEAIGDGVDTVLRGRRVAAITDSGYAEKTLAAAADLMPLPDALTWEQGAAFPIQGLTAYHVLHTAGRLRAGESVLVHAAAGGVGQWCVQLAVRAGARVFGTCSTKRKVEIVRALGAEDAFLYGPDVVPKLRERTGGRGVDVVVDSVGRDTRKTSLEALAPFGRLVHVGSASGDPEPVDIDDLYEKSIQVGAFWLRTPLPPAVAQAAVSALVKGLASGSLRTPPTTKFPLAEAGEAHRALESRRTEGKLLLDVG
jgi:NADPH2:quinone reductase